VYKELSLLLRKLARRALSAWEKSRPSVSFSQSGEDLIIRFIFNALRITEPTYLDIGAYHPIHFSNTYLFYKNGSCGVCVEPDPQLIAAFRRRRPWDICINIGIGVGQKTTADFYILSSKTLNTFSKSEAEKYAGYGQLIEKVIPIPLATINEILNNYFSEKAPNFISLDIEGLDLEVIKTLDFSKYRPEVFCIETLTYTEDKTEEKVSQIVDYMKSKDYFVYADTYINTIFVDRTAWGER
jgi:FkbM family methyltransferase